jgi:hypothetical protein
MTVKGLRPVSTVIPPNTACNKVPIKGKNDQRIIFRFSFIKEKTKSAMDIARTRKVNVLLPNSMYL